MKIEDYRKAKVILESAKNAKDFYGYVIRKLVEVKSSAARAEGDIFECIKVVDFVIDYLEVEKKMAMEKAEKMIEEI